MTISNQKDIKGLENQRRIEHLENLVEKHTRTERHLEEHADIASSPENIEHAKQVNRKREEEIDHLKNIIAYGENHANDPIDNTEKRYQFTEGYIRHNEDHMDQESLKNAKVKQEHRKEQLDNYR